MLKDYIKGLLQLLLPKKGLTLLAGLFANNTHPKIKNFLIQYFIKAYAVNMSEAREENPKNYLSFNDFFIRNLKPGCRPLEKSDIISPVDGFVSELGHINKGQILQAKKCWYQVEELLAHDTEINNRFNEGSFATLYLSPKDYHRVHMPLNATLKSMIYIPGQLFSVQPATVRVIPRLFSRNERLVNLFETEKGLMAMVLVGATIVGAIGNHWEGEMQRSNKKKRFEYPENSVQTQIQRGEEMGYFKLGSTVILLFENKIKMQWEESLHPGKTIRLGETLGQFI